jgi:AcrR family transcriptional regulator
MVSQDTGVPDAGRPVQAIGSIGCPARITASVVSVPQSQPPPARGRILDAAVTYVSEHPGQDMPLRAVCAAAGVQLPTLYHYFGSKQGLLDEVEKIGFRRFMALKLEVQNSGNFLTDMQIGWDRHIEFAMDNPGLYLLMYGQLQPGSINPGRREPEEYTLELCRKADREGILVVSPELAAAHIMCTCIGAALRFIVYGAVDTVLSRAILQATLDAVTGSDHRAASPRVTTAARELLLALAEEDVDLDGPELNLLQHWLQRM